MPSVPNQEGVITMSESNIPYKIYLAEDEMPTTWYNLRADMKNKPAFSIPARSSP